MAGENLTQDIVVRANPNHFGSICCADHPAFDEERERIKLGRSGGAHAGHGMAAQIVDGVERRTVGHDDDTVVSAYAIRVFGLNKDFGLEAVHGEDGDEGAQEGDINFAIFEILEDGEIGIAGTELDTAREFAAEISCKCLVLLVLHEDVALGDQADAEGFLIGHRGGCGGSAGDGATGEAAKPDERNCRQDKE